LRIETSTPTIKDARTIGTSQGEKMDWNRANEASEQLVEATWETYRMLANYTLSLQQRNARFVQKMIDGSIKELRRQVEHNRTITDGLLELAERRREALRELVEASVSGGYTNFFFAPFTPLSYYREEMRSTAYKSGGRRSNGRLPIDYYDQLTAREISERLEDLSEQEIQIIRSYEQQHKNRGSLLRQLDRRLT
jgi:hypothetical protein